MNNIAVPPMKSFRELREASAAEKHDVPKTGQSMPEKPTDQPKSSKTGKPFQLKGLDGVYADALFQLDDEIIMGRDVSKVNVIYPADTPGISRVHCSIRVDAKGQVLLKDLGSSQGTYFADGTKLKANTAYRLKRGECFYLASKRQTYKLI